MISTATAEQARPGEQAKCVRCDIPRTVRPGRVISPLCRDCRAVLTPEERARWVDAAEQEPLTPDTRANLRAQVLHANPRTAVRTTP